MPTDSLHLQIGAERVTLPAGDFDFVIGRGVDAWIRIPDSVASRRHARLVSSGGAVAIEDLGSRSGTFVNGARIDGPTVLSPGDRIRIGHTDVVFGSPAPTPSAAPTPVANRPAAGADGGDAAPDPRETALREEFRFAALMCEPDAMALKRRLHARILEKMNLSEDATELTTDETLRPRLEECLNQTLREQRHELPSDIPYEVFRQALMDELVGYGPITPMLRSPRVSEVMVNGPDRIFVESKGLLFETGVRFFDEKHLQQIIRRIVEPLGRHVDDASPMVDARLPDGSRVHAVIPPLSRVGTVIAIRKFKKDTLTIDKMQEFGSLDESMRRLLRALVLLHKNVIVSGATSSGKTSVLNALSSFIPEGERVLVIEDATELQLQQRHIVPFETRKADKNGQGEVTIRDLIRSALRLRPDRIVIGEIRGGEALDLLQALNTGHAGSMSTIHANSPIDCLSRIETCALLSGIDVPLTALRSQVASAIDAVVHTARLSDGSRKVVSVAEVEPLSQGEYKVRELVAWRTESIAPDGTVKGRFEHVNTPSFAEEARIVGVEL